MMIRHNVRGDWNLGSLILAVVVGMVILTIALKFTNLFDGPANIKTCQLSTIAAAQSRGGGPLTVTRKCQTDIDQDMERLTDKSKVLQKVADHLWECWWENGEGKYHAFTGSAFTKQTHCFVCSQFALNPKFDSKTPDTRITQDDVLNELTKSHYTGRPETIAAFLKDAILTVQGEQHLLVQKVDLPEDATPSERTLESIKVGLGAEMATGIGVLLGAPGMAAAVTLDAKAIAALWQIWFDDAKVLPMQYLQYDARANPDQQYVVVFSQVSDEFLRQTWIARLLGKAVGADTLIAVPPAKIMITKLSLLADSNCEELQG